MSRIDLDGVLGMAPLPHPSAGKTEIRWSFGRKAQLIFGIRDNSFTAAEACAAWNLTPEEIESWCRRYRRWGLDGLKSSRVQCANPNRPVHLGHRRFR